MIRYKPKINLRAKAFAKAYIKHNFDGAKAAMEVYNIGSKGATKKRHSASALAWSVLRKPEFQNALLEELEKQKLTEKVAVKIHKRNLEQSDNLPASNSALDMYYRIKGYYAPEKSANLNIDLTLIDKEIEEIVKELKEIKEIEAKSSNSKQAQNNPKSKKNN